MNEELFLKQMKDFDAYVAHPLLATQLSNTAKLSDVAQEIALTILMQGFDRINDQEY